MLENVGNFLAGAGTFMTGLAALIAALKPRSKKRNKEDRK